MSAQPVSGLWPDYRDMPAQANTSTVGDGKSYEAPVQQIQPATRDAEDHIVKG